MRKIFTDNLPKNKNRINWIESVNKKLTIDFIYEDICGKLKLVDYNLKDRKIKFEYHKDVYEMHYSDFINARFRYVLGKITKEFRYNVGDSILDDFKSIIIIDKKYIKNKKGYGTKHYRYKCNNCGFDCGEHYKNGEYKEEYWVPEYSLMESFSCPVCGKIIKIVVPKINSIVANEETHWMIPYFQGGYDEAKKYTPQSNRKVKIICPECGKVKDNKMIIGNLYKYHSINCICGDNISYPEKFVYSMLKQFNIKFKMQYSPTWIKPKKYDFYFKLSDEEYIIETDGKWHYKDNNMSGQTKEESKVIDDYKDKLAEEHNIKVIRIDCEFSNLNFIKNNILKSELNGIFDLAKVDWNKCEEFALSNLVKKACEIKRDSPEMTTTEIGLQLNLDRQTIRKYLTKGSKIWNWCKYDTKEESIKNYKNNFDSDKSILNTIEIKISKDGILLGIFESINYISENCKSLFGVILEKEQIRRVCKGVRNIYKGYKFEFYYGGIQNEK